nr:MAG TPA: hypothetical protein [Caudoviricetes sp.]
MKWLRVRFSPAAPKVKALKTPFDRRIRGFFI